MNTLRGPLSGPLRVGLVGLSSDQGWGAKAHAPALTAVPGVELRAVATSSMQSAKESAARHGIPFWFDNVYDLASHDDVDLVVIAVKVPLHRELVLAALKAGKPVLCEWPLATNLSEARSLVAAAEGTRSFVGLQARSSPSVRYLRDLVAEGFVGEVLSTSVIGSGRPWGAQVTTRTEYVLDRAQGATMLTIPFGHTIDALAMVLGDLAEITATTATRRREVLNVDSGSFMPMDAEDQIAITGMLESGAVASVHYRGGTSRGTSFLWEINGTEGDLQVRSSSGSIQLGRITIRGSRSPEGTLVDRPVPSAYDHFPHLSGQPAHPLAHVYDGILHDLVRGTNAVPDFQHALRLHQLLESVQQAAARPPCRISPV